MTLYLVEARNVQGSLLSLPFEDISGGYLVADVDGIGPVKATIVSSGYAGQDGTQYQHSRRDDRNILIRVELHPDFVTNSVQSLRRRLYDYFMTKSEVFLRLYDTDGPTVDISGRVEDCKPAIFTQTPAVDISIICFDPDFKELESIQVNGMSTATEDEMLIEYSGTVETGIEFVMNVDRALTDFTIYHRPPDGTLKTLDFAHPLLAGDILTINTVSGNKRVTLTRSGSDSSLLRGMSPQSNWIELSKGDNYIRVYAEGAGIPFSISYLTRHGGL